MGAGSLRTLVGVEFIPLEIGSVELLYGVIVLQEAGVVRNLPLKSHVSEHSSNESGFAFFIGNTIALIGRGMASNAARRRFSAATGHADSAKAAGLCCFAAMTLRPSTPLRQSTVDADSYHDLGSIRIQLVMSRLSEGGWNSPYGTPRQLVSFS